MTDKKRLEINISLGFEELSKYHINWYLQSAKRPEARFVEAEIVSGTRYRKKLKQSSVLRLHTDDKSIINFFGVACGTNDEKSNAIILALEGAGFALNDRQKIEIMMHDSMHIIFYR